MMGFVSVLWFSCLLIYERVIVWVTVKARAPDKAPAKDGSSINQLLGIKGAAQETVGLFSFSLSFGCFVIFSAGILPGISFFLFQK